MNEEQRFWGRVDKRGPDDCWNWTGGKLPWGYGKFWFDGKEIRAHRFSWILHFGEIKSGYFVCHKCDNPSCVNPKHLFLGTARDNTMDMINKGRANRNRAGVKFVPAKIHGTHSHPESRPFGERNGSAKLNNKIVQEIRTLYKAKISQRELAAKFCISKSQIGRIVNNKNWLPK